MPKVYKYNIKSRYNGYRTLVKYSITTIYYLTIIPLRRPYP